MTLILFCFAAFVRSFGFGFWVLVSFFLANLFETGNFRLKELTQKCFIMSFLKGDEIQRLDIAKTNNFRSNLRDPT